MSRLLLGQWLQLVVAAWVAMAGLGACVTLGSRGIAASSGTNVPVGSTGRAVREVYVGPGVVQYFLLPQILKGPADEYAELDIVVRDSAQLLRYGLLHLSVVAPKAVHFPADTLLLSAPGQPLALPAARVLFSEPKGKKTLTRLEVYLTPAQTRAYLRNANQAVMLGGATRRRFEPGKKAAMALTAFAGRVLSPSRL